MIIVDLDDISRPYGRVLASLRILRALLCGATSTVLTIVLFVLAIAVFASSPRELLVVAGVVAGIVSVGAATIIVVRYGRRRLTRCSVRAAVVLLAVVAMLLLALLSGLLEPDWESLLLIAILIAVPGIFILLEYGRRRLSRGSVRAAVVLLAVVAMLLLASLATLVQLAWNFRLLEPGVIMLELTSLALVGYIWSLVAVGSVETIRMRRRDWFDWCFAAGRPTQRTELLHLIGLPATSTGRVPRRAILVAVIAVLIDGGGFAAYMGIADRMSRYAEKNPDVSIAGALGVIFLALIFSFGGARVTFAIGRRLRRRARRLLMQSAEQVVATDTRPPVLFLRSFSDDQVSLDKAFVPFYLHLLDPGVAAGTLEELIVRNYTDRGPVIAIGSPGDKAPPIGAARYYVGGGSWQDSVMKLAEEATAIVVGVSETAGVLWEVEMLMTRNHLGKSVFVIPPDPPSTQYDTLREDTQHPASHPSEPAQHRELLERLSRQHGIDLQSLAERAERAEHALADPVATRRARRAVLEKLGEKLGIDLVSIEDDGDRQGRILAVFHDHGGRAVVMTSRRATELEYEIALKAAPFLQSTNPTSK